MTLIADILLISGAFGAAFYCMLLSRRLNRLSDLDGGVGKAISDLNAQVSDLSKTLQQARSSAAGSAETLADLTARAESVAASLEVMLDTAQAVSQPQAGTPRGPEPRGEQGLGNGQASEAPAAGERAERPAMPSFIRGRAVRTAAE